MWRGPSSPARAGRKATSRSSGNGSTRAATKPSPTHLHSLDLSKFDPKAPPIQTPAFWAIVNASRVPEDAELADALEALGWPDVTTLGKVSEYASDDFGAWLKDRKNARKIAPRFEHCGYEHVRNEDAKDGLWKVNGRRQAIYGKKELSDGARQAAASRLTGIFYKKAG